MGPKLCKETEENIVTKYKLGIDTILVIFILFEQFILSNVRNKRKKRVRKKAGLMRVNRTFESLAQFMIEKNRENLEKLIPCL